MHILVIDDEKNIRQTLFNILADEGHAVNLAESGEMGLEQIKKISFDLVFLDVKLPNMNGIEVLKNIKIDCPETDVLMISGNSDIHTAVNAVKSGAYDFMEKPLSLPKILIAVQNIAEKQRLYQKCTIGKQVEDIRYRIIGQSPQINKIREMIQRVAKTDAKVLITGESGTGKELVAFAIHKISERSENPFITFNSAAIPKDLVESELFGHERGAFTGADRQKPGKLEIASGGTIFLDEIGDMGIDAQSKILRVLEEGRFERVGGNRTIEVDVRVLAATNRKIEQMVHEGAFREDLYFRLNVVPFYLPPLRERTGDIPVLLNHYLKHFSQELTTREKHFSDDALDEIKKYHFPGNIRELKNLVERLYILSDNQEINLGEVLQNMVVRRRSEKTDATDFLKEKNFSNARNAFEKYYLTEKLKAAHWNISRAAIEIGLQQPNLSRKLKSLGIELP